MMKLLAHWTLMWVDVGVSGGDSIAASFSIGVKRAISTESFELAV